MGPSCLYSRFFQAEDGIRDVAVTGVQTCALPISYLPEIHGDFFDVTRFDLGHELAVTRLVFTRLSAVCGDQLPEHHSQQNNGHPEENCLYRRTGIHVSLSSSGSRRKLPLSCVLFPSFATVSGRKVRS